MSRGAFYVLFTASGFAGLIYESLWTHYLKLFLGHAAYAQSLVLVVFMGGMAGGAALCARVSPRIANPLAVYAAVEAAIGLLALVFHPTFVALTDWGYASLLPRAGSEGGALAVKLALSCVLILPQSLLLGATFPLMSAGIARALPGRAGESVAMLYFTNSLGAAAGVLASAFLLIGWLGLPGTLRAAGVLNLAIAGAMMLLARPLPALAATRGAPPAARLLLAVAFFTGLASFIYEIVWIRMLVLVLGASTHAFELMLATFIFGLALGGLAVRRRVDTSPEPARLLGWVQVVMGLAALATLPVYDFTFGLMEALMRGLAKNDTGYALFNLAGGGIAALVMLPATFCAGMTLPLLTGALLRDGAGEAAVGRVYAANTLGAIAGVVFAVHIGLPLLGIKGSLIAGCVVDAVLGLVLLGVFGTRAMSLRAGAVCAAAFVAVAAGVRLDVNKMTAGVFRHSSLETSRDARVLYARDGKTATVHLVKYPDDAISLRTNGKSDGSINMERGVDRGTDEITMVLTGALPLALKPDAKSAAVIGIGTGLFHAGKQARDLLDFFGAVVIGFFRQFVQPRRIRIISLIAQIEQAGFNAMPIIGLISFLIGVVLAYQGYDQLRAFGGQIFTVNLVGISVLREMGILLTAIIVAGRTGSSFTAQIGTMQVNEEVDALRTLGLDPLDVLVLPRVTALMIALPLLTFYSDMCALLGGGVACVLLLDMSPSQYLTQLGHAVTLAHFLVGMSKAPIFALLISMVGCFEGLRVTGSAESVGQLTTQSVVESLFLVIVFDAMFSVLFSFLRI
jgi:ABC transport permease subunit